MGEEEISAGIQKAKQKTASSKVKMVARLRRPQRSEARPMKGRPSIWPRLRRAPMMAPCCAVRPIEVA